MTQERMVRLEIQRDAPRSCIIIDVDIGPKLNI